MPKPPPWTAKEVALLGTATDSAIAKKIGRGIRGVETKRLALGIAPSRLHKFQWSKRAVALLGKVADAQVATKLSLRRNAVIRERLRRKIPCAHSANTPIKFRP